MLSSFFPLFILPSRIHRQWRSSILTLTQCIFSFTTQRKDNNFYAARVSNNIAPLLASKFQWIQNKNQGRINDSTFRDTFNENNRVFIIEISTWIHCCCCLLASFQSSTVIIAIINLNVSSSESSFSYILNRLQWWSL